MCVGLQPRRNLCTLPVDGGWSDARCAPSATGLETRTEFMAQPGLGVIIKVWESADGSGSCALRPDIKARWTHGWAHAPGNPVDALYVLGLTFSFGPGGRVAAVIPPSQHS